jgi:predicted transcriptional regulator
MTPKARRLVLTRSQAACLIALRRRKDTQPEIAIEAKLDIKKTAGALRALADLGLAKQGHTKRWHATARGKTCRFETDRSRPIRNNGQPSSSGRRLLELLDRPMPGSKIVEKLGVTHQRVRQLLIKLHAEGSLAFGDPDRPFWIVMRAADKTPILSRDEERVLSVIPREYATDATKIRLAARMPESKVRKILEGLIVRKFAEALEGLQGTRVFRITPAGLDHPQRAQSARRARAPRLPVESDRVRNVLSVISDSGKLRIRDVANMLRLPPQSINALMQYLKRKHFVEKNGQELNAPYSLTERGHAALGEMARRQAA